MTSETSAPYVLGVSDYEVRRLIFQSQYYRSATEDALHRAGIEPGMRVLDVGTGAGGVALLLADLVGRHGSVTAVDSSATMLEVARAQAGLHRVGNVEFMRADLTEWAPTETYDAVVGRLVLVHLPDPVATLARLTPAVRPGGLVVFSEFVISAARQDPPTTVFTTALDRVLTAFTAAGRPVDMGFRLGTTFRAAGLPSPELYLGGVLEEGADSGAYAMLADVTRTLLPLMVQAGIATADEVAVDSLEARLREAAEAVAGVDCLVCPPPLASAWCRLPV